MYLPLLIFLISVHTVISSEATECNGDCTDTPDVVNDVESADNTIYGEIPDNTIDISNHTSEMTNTTVKQAVLVKTTNDTMFLAKPLDPEEKVLDQLSDIHLDTYKESEGTLVKAEVNATEDTTEMYEPTQINTLMSIFDQIPIDMRRAFTQALHPAPQNGPSTSEQGYTPTPKDTSKSSLEQLMGGPVPPLISLEEKHPKYYAIRPQPSQERDKVQIINAATEEYNEPITTEADSAMTEESAITKLETIPPENGQPHPKTNQNDTEEDIIYSDIPKAPLSQPHLPHHPRKPRDKVKKHAKRPKHYKHVPKIEDPCDVDYANLLNAMDDSFYSSGKCEIKQFAFNDGSVGPQETPDVGLLENNMLFSINNPDHMQEMKQLMEIFLKCDKLSDLKNAALYYKPRVNKMLYTFAFSSSILYRKDTQSFSVPGLYNVMPDHFFNAATISEGKNVIEKSQFKFNLPTGKRPKTKTVIRRGSKDRTSEVFDKSKNSRLIADSNKTITAKNRKKFFKSKPRHPKNTSHTEKNHVNVQRKVLPKQKQQTFSEINPYLTGTIQNPEHQVAYFREDIAANSHHWHWHLVYANHLPHNIVPNRKGELFYYMHNQMLRRYDAERLASKLAFVKPLVLEHNATIQEGYYPHLSSANTKAQFSGRSEQLKIQDINNPTFNLKVKIKNMIYWKNNLNQAIKDGYMIHINGSRILINNVGGIDFLGAAIEASIASPNTKLYGQLGLHNAGHIVISNLHDPHGKFNAPQGVMCATETALRDPVFWRWHKMVDDIFADHKAHLPAYTDKELLFSDVRITEMLVTTNREPVQKIKNQRKYKKNQLGTFFKSTTMDMSRAIDFKAQDEVAKIRIYHLDHHQFIIKLVAEVDGGEELEGQVRIFISPRNDQKGKRLKDHELYKQAIEMDRFPVNLKPGRNFIQRDSRESAVTMAPKRQWTVLSEVNPKFHDKNNLASFCGCGWPDHLLLPKGSKNGMKYVMFVMISDRSVEKVEDDDNDNYENQDDLDILRTCDDSLTMCGLLRRKFPDLRAMGFPFDRPIPSSSQNWFKRSNMKLHDITIYLENEMHDIYNDNKRR